MNYQDHIGNFVKYNRSKLKLTQEELAQKAGVGLRFIRELEQGKATLRMDKVNQVLDLFGFTLAPKSQRLADAYEILTLFFDKEIHVHLRNKTILIGFFTEAVYEGPEVRAWKFVDKNNAVEYRKTSNAELVQMILHADIEKVELL